jgi:hypothetical protein
MTAVPGRGAAAAATDAAVSACLAVVQIPPQPLPLHDQKLLDRLQQRLRQQRGECVHTCGWGRSWVQWLQRGAVE